MVWKFSMYDTVQSTNCTQSVFFKREGKRETETERVQPTRAEGCVTSQCLFKEEFWVSSDATAWVSAGLSGTRTSVLMTYIHETASQTQKATWLEPLHSFTQNSTKFTRFYNSLLRNILKETKLPAPVGISQKNLIGQQQSTILMCKGEQYA